MSTRGGSETRSFEGLFADGQAAWGEVRLAFEAFGGHLRRLGFVDPAPSAHGADLYLAFACLDGEAKAIDHFEALLQQTARPVVGRIRAADDFIEEVLQELRTKLLVGESPALAAYAGRGPLVAWLRVAATRAAIDHLRSAGASPPVQEMSEVLDPADSDPEVKMLMAAHREAFEEALRSALGALTAKERNLLRRHMVDGMTLEEMALPYGVHPATIARRLASLREDIAIAVRQRLAAHLGTLAPAQMDSVFRAIRSKVHVSLSPLLATESWVSPPGATQETVRATRLDPKAR